MKLVSLVGQDCGGMPALALRKYTDEKDIEAIEELAKPAGCFRHATKKKIDEWIQIQAKKHPKRYWLHWRS